MVKSDLPWFKNANSSYKHEKRVRNYKQIVESLSSSHPYISSKAPLSLQPKIKYCDVTGLETIHTDPKSGLHFYDASVYQVIKEFSPATIQAYLSVRNAAVVLK